MTPPQSKKSSLERTINRLQGVDAELRGLAKGALSYLVSEEQLESYIKITAPFNKGVVHMSESYPGEFLINFDAEGKKVHCYHLRKDLENFPAYFEKMGKVGFPPADAFELLTTIHKIYPYQNIYNPTQSIIRLTEAAKTCEEKGQNLFEHKDRFASLLNIIKKDGEVERCIGVFQLGIAAGFSVDQAVKTIENVDTYGWCNGYVLADLWDTMSSFRTHNFKPDRLFEAIQVVIKSREKPAHFKEAVYAISANHGSSGGEVYIESVIKHGISNENGQTPLLAAFKDQAVAVLMDNNARQKQSTELQPVNISPETYFPDIGLQRITHGDFPYRIKRGLLQGIEDLREADQQSHVSGTLSEGFFVFDPRAETWYSLGGATKVMPGWESEDRRARLRHEANFYDASKLSACPIFVHVHPHDGETFITVPRESLSHTCMQTRLTKFLAAIPSGADFNALAEFAERAEKPFDLHGLIITTCGLTVFKAPRDTAEVKEFADKFRDMKDQVMLNFDVQSYLDRGGFQESDEVFARKMVARVNDTLPSGYAVITIPYEALHGPQTPGNRAVALRGLDIA